MESMSTARSKQILALLAVVQLMSILNFSLVNVALPPIQRTFHLIAKPMLNPHASIFLFEAKWQGYLAKYKTC